MNGARPHRAETALGNRPVSEAVLLTPVSLTMMRRARPHDRVPTMDRSETEHATLELLLFVICLVLLAAIVGGMFLR